MALAPPPQSEFDLGSLDITFFSDRLGWQDGENIEMWVYFLQTTLDFWNTMQ